jgi:hypothetical protein
MKAVELAATQEDDWCNIAITLTTSVACGHYWNLRPTWSARLRLLAGTFLIRRIVVQQESRLARQTLQ